VPFAAAGDGLRLAIRLTPKASANRILGVVNNGRGGTVLKAAVTAAPVDGKANAALLKLLARHFQLRPGDLTVAKGANDRSKLIAIAGDPVTLVGLMTEGLRPWLTRD
jgi:uncharacterized protein